MEGFKKSVRRRFLMKKGTKAMYKDWKKADSQLQRETASDDDDLWHRTKSVLVLSRGDSGSTSTDGYPPKHQNIISKGQISVWVSCTSKSKSLTSFCQEDKTAT